METRIESPLEVETLASRPQVELSLTTPLQVRADPGRVDRPVAK